MKININSNPYATDFYYKGQYTDKHNKVFNFELANRDSEGNTIYWFEGEPTDDIEELTEIENAILDEFLEI